MFEAGFLLSGLAVLSPLVGAVAAFRSARPRVVSAFATAFALLSTVGSIALNRPATGWLAIDDLAGAPAVIITGLLLAILSAAPRRDVSPSTCSRMLVALAGVLMVYASGSPIVLFAGWTLSALPFLTRNRAEEHGAKPRWFARPMVTLGGSVVLLGIALVMLSMRSHGETSSVAAFTLVVLAVLIRSGIFPFHSWVIKSFESSSFLSYAWLLSARTGAFVLAKLILPEFVEPAQAVLPILSDLALFSSVLMAFVALGEKSPAAYLGSSSSVKAVSSSADLQTANVEGVTGALLQWLVVSVSTVGLAILLRCLEERCGSLLQQPFAGLGAKAPRMAVLFLLFALCLVGFPGSLGFCAEDLLFHGALEMHPFLGIALPIATALIGIRLLGLFSTIFLGTPRYSHTVNCGCAAARALGADGISGHPVDYWFRTEDDGGLQIRSGPSDCCVS